MADDREEAVEEELPDEIFGLLRLKRKKGGTSYKFVTKPGLSKNKPFQARVKNKRTNKTQHLGSFATAHAAAVEVARVLAQQDDEDMASPRKHAARGVVTPSHTCCSTSSQSHMPGTCPHVSQAA